MMQKQWFFVKVISVIFPSIVLCTYIADVYLSYRTSVMFGVSSTVPLNGISQVTLTSDGCNGDVKFLEHVEAVVAMSASVRGQVTSLFGDHTITIDCTARHLSFLVLATNRTLLTSVSIHTELPWGREQ